MDEYYTDIDHFETISDGSPYVRHEGGWLPHVFLGLLRDADDRHCLRVAHRLSSS
jgi:hypothetical protein